MNQTFTDIIGTINAEERPPQGCNFDVTLLHADEGKFIVKTGNTPEKIDELEREAEILYELAEYQPCVPCFLTREENQFLFTYIEGENLVTTLQKPDIDETTRQRLIFEYGAFLRHIHSWNPAFPESNDWLTEAIAKATDNVKTGVITGTIDEFNFHSGKTVNELLAYLQEQKVNYASDTVFSHGDWCMPNVIVEEGTVTAAIDWSNGGYKDYRYDIATALWSLSRNGYKDLTALFVDGYNNGYEWEDYVSPASDNVSAYDLAMSKNSLPQSSQECREYFAFFEALYALL